MKRPLILHIRLLLSLVAGLVLVTGCARTICLRVVDSNTSQLLSGVSVRWREDAAYNLLTGRRYSTGPTNFGSGDDGVITVGGIHKKWVSRFVFSRDGYATLYGTYTREKLELAERIKPDPLPQDRFILEEPRVVVGPSNGCFLVKMPK